MAVANLVNGSTTIDTNNDSLVIVRNLDAVRGGRTLDVTGYGPAVVNGVDTFGAITGGTGYVNGTYTNVPLTGGTGTGATADIVVSGGVVTSVTKRVSGQNYTAGDSLSAATANLGGGTGTGFSVLVATVKSTDKAEFLNAGHIIIRETATGEFKPMPTAAGVYSALPAGHTYAGILIASVLTERPFAGIMTNGTVNDVASPFPVSAAVKTAIWGTEGLSITFRAD